MTHPSLASVASPAATALIAAGHSISVAESSCGGLISAALVAIPGASAYYVGGGIIYTATGGKALLPPRPKGMQSATEAFALFEAQSIREKMASTWGIGETGASGPSGNPYGNPPGHACIAISGPIERVITLATGNSDRESNMWAFTKAALELLEAVLADYKKP